MDAFLWIVLGVFFVGVGAWGFGHWKWTRHLPKFDPLRGKATIPGFLLVVISIVLFAFYWHWIVGGLAIIGVGYAGYRLILG